MFTLNCHSPGPTARMSSVRGVEPLTAKPVSTLPLLAPLMLDEEERLSSSEPVGVPTS